MTILLCWVNRISRAEEGRDVPVDGGHDTVLGERRGGIVTPYRVSLILAFAGRVEGVVDGGDQEDDVGDQRGDAVEDEFPGGEVLAAGERVHCSLHVSHVHRGWSDGALGRQCLKSALTAGAARRSTVLISHYALDVGSTLGERRRGIDVERWGLRLMKRKQGLSPQGTSLEP